MLLDEPADNVGIAVQPASLPLEHIEYNQELEI